MGIMVDRLLWGRVYYDVSRIVVVDDGDDIGITVYHFLPFFVVHVVVPTVFVFVGILYVARHGSFYFERINGTLDPQRDDP
jgi:hypothetical protein